jgi:hypothetical protein
VSCPINNMAFAGDQLAVFQGASEAPISEFIRFERATRKNSQLATARRVAMKMGRRLSRGCGIGLRINLDMRPPRALPKAHFDRNESHGIYGTGH